MNRVIKFDSFEPCNIGMDQTFETTYKPDKNGNMIAQKWAFYKDFYPEKYGEFKEMDIAYVWIITKDDNKVGVFSSVLEENEMRSIIEFLRNKEDGYETKSDRGKESDT